MCGRYTLTADAESIQLAFDLKTVPDWRPRYNIAPSQLAPVITSENPGQLTFLKWGLVPSWAKDPAIGSRMINARAETAAEKPSFRAAFKRRRCLVPADGFFEWARRGSRKAPMYIHLENRGLFAFAGLWESRANSDGSKLETCTILTTEANELIRPLHHRMAVMLAPEHYQVWLSPKARAEELTLLMSPCPAEKMRVYEVSPQVNHPANDHPAVIEPFEPPRQHGLL